MLKSANSVKACYYSHPHCALLSMTGRSHCVEQWRTMAAGGQRALIWYVAAATVNWCWRLYPGILVSIAAVKGGDTPWLIALLTVSWHVLCFSSRQTVHSRWRPHADNGCLQWSHCAHSLAQLTKCRFRVRVRVSENACCSIQIRTIETSDYRHRSSYMTPASIVIEMCVIHKSFSCFISFIS